MSYGSRRHLLGLSAAAGLAMLGARASAQALDVVKIVTGFPPGGTADSLSRYVAEGLKAGPFARMAVVENKPGAGGQIAIQAIRGAAIDGSVLLLTPASMLIIYPHIYKRLAYDPLVDVTALSLAGSYDFAFAVGPTVPAAVKSIPDFLAWCQATPALANFGSPAAGSMPHFIGVLLGQSRGVDLKHVGYRGTQPAIQDLVAGHIQAVSAPIGDFLQHAHAGKIRLIGVSSQQRSRHAPDVPTYVEQGLKGMVFSEWFAFFAPRGIADPAVRRAHEALAAALAQKEVVDRLIEVGVEVGSSTPDELSRRLKADLDAWGPIVKKIGFTAES